MESIIHNTKGTYDDLLIPSLLPLSTQTKVSMNEKLPLRVSPHFCRWLLVTIAFMVTFHAHSQGLVVRGKVTNPDGESIPGANVSIQGTTLGTVTDSNGAYSIQTQDGNQTLVFSFIGYVSQKVVVGGRSVIDVVLESDIKSLEEVVRSEERRVGRDGR